MMEGLLLLWLDYLCAMEITCRVYFFRYWNILQRSLVNISLRWMSLSLVSAPQSANCLDRLLVPIGQLPFAAQQFPTFRSFSQFRFWLLHSLIHSIFSCLHKTHFYGGAHLRRIRDSGSRSCDDCLLQHFLACWINVWAGPSSFFSVLAPLVFVSQSVVDPLEHLRFPLTTTVHRMIPYCTSSAIFFLRKKSRLLWSVFFQFVLIATNRLLVSLAYYFESRKYSL